MASSATPSRVTRWRPSIPATTDRTPSAWRSGRAIAGGATLEGARILDLAPTLLDHFGIEVPPHMTGRVLRELCGAEPWPAAD